jgi:hypothetical protein
MLVQMLSLVEEAVVLVVCLESLPMVSLLVVLNLVINTVLGEVAILSLRRATNHAFPFVVVVPLQSDRSGLPMVVLGLTRWIAVLIGMVG